MAAQSEPENPAAQSHAADLYADHRNYSEAIRYYERALQLRPDDVTVRGDLGTALWYAGSPKKAVEQYSICLEKRPNDPATLFNLGFVRAVSLGDNAGAIRAWKQLLKTNPAFPDKDQVLQLIAEAEQESRPGND